MSFITDIFKGGTSGILDGVGTIISKFVADPTAKQQMTVEIQKELILRQEEMANLAEKQYEAQLKDIQDARLREATIATSKDAPLLNKISLPVLALFITSGFFGLLWYMLTHDVPAGNKDILNVMLGSLGTAWITIVSYYFGSSSGSTEKNQQIKSLTDKLLPE